ncbi:MAG: ATP-binding protein [Candidatus Bipolaricaulia bacterium]
MSEATEVLRSGLKVGRLSHAYLLIGEGGVPHARELADEIICGDDRDCGSKIARGVHPDLQIVARDGERIGIDQIRALKLDARYPPTEGRYKVYLIDEVEAMSPEAANSILRLLEEPPPYLVFLLVSASLAGVPATIVSRCQVLRLRTGSQKHLRSQLAAYDLEDREVDYALSVAKGRIDRLTELPLEEGLLARRQAVHAELSDLEPDQLVDRLLNGDSIVRREASLELLKRLPHLQVFEVLAVAGRLSRASNRDALDRLFEEAALWYRDLLSVIEGGAVWNLDRVDRLNELNSDFESGKLIDLVGKLEEGRRSLRENANLQLLCESLLFEIQAVSDSEP